MSCSFCIGLLISQLKKGNWLENDTGSEFHFVFVDSYSYQCQIALGAIDSKMQSPIPPFIVA